MKNRRDEGFTLIELLIVIVILGILATIVVFSVRGVTDQGKTNSCKADYKTLETAIEAYYAQYGSTTTPGMTDLTGSRLLRSPSSNYTVAGGQPAPTAACTGIT
jgi:prepilin-type N-terminal cleavage/methylation domain-containing protein